jgi:hypothetical protein
VFQENIQEIERTLNEQIFGPSANVTSDLVNVGEAPSDLGTTVEIADSDSEAESTTTEDLAHTLGATTSPSAQPNASALGSLSEEPKNDGNNKNPAEPSNNGSVFANTFDSSGFESCVFSAITLQVRNLSYFMIESFLLSVKISYWNPYLMSLSLRFSVILTLHFTDAKSECFY